eukprot:Awhi_evm1s15317
MGLLKLCTLSLMLLAQLAAAKDGFVQVRVSSLYHIKFIIAAKNLDDEDITGEIEPYVIVSLDEDGISFSDEDLRSGEATLSKTNEDIFEFLKDNVLTFKEVSNAEESELKFKAYDNDSGNFDDDLGDLDFEMEDETWVRGTEKIFSKTIDFDLLSSSAVLTFGVTVLDKATPGITTKKPGKTEIASSTGAGFIKVRVFGLKNPDDEDVSGEIEPYVICDLDENGITLGFDQSLRSGEATVDPNDDDIYEFKTKNTLTFESVDEPEEAELKFKIYDEDTGNLDDSLGELDFEMDDETWVRGVEQVFEETIDFDLFTSSAKMSFGVTVLDVSKPGISTTKLPKTIFRRRRAFERKLLHMQRKRRSQKA